ncbi:MAG TPA: heparan-alpha-glucosaminide N-acetyltransferase domain-containing protein [Myxococcales bacterium]|jgi:uncharacterized membrane protein
MNRRRDIDWMRGIAVLCMVEHHTFDAFLRPDLHGTTPDRIFRFVGGFAAPSFLFLAGLAMALVLHKRTASKSAGGLQKGPAVSPREAALAGMKRGLYIVFGAYLFRLQEWVLAFGGAPLRDLLRIDILNCIGIALALVALVFWVGKGRISAFLLAAGAVVALTPVVTAADLSALPQHLGDYLNGTMPRAIFPLFPWVAHAFLGAAAGIALLRTRNEAPLIALFAGLAFAAWLLPKPAQWSDAAPSVFLLRDGLAAGLLAACWLSDRLLPKSVLQGPMLVLGRHSLLVYWVHVEIVYGRWFWRSRGTLGLAQGALAVVILTATMIALAYAASAWQASRKLARSGVALRPVGALK